MAKASLSKKLSEAQELIKQQQRDIEHYQEEYVLYERMKVKYKSMEIALSVHQDYVFMLLEFLRAAKALPTETEDLIANWNPNKKTWAAHRGLTTGG